LVETQIALNNKQSFIRAVSHAAVAEIDASTQGLNDEDAV
jgi:hypothetical protein